MKKLLLLALAGLIVSTVPVASSGAAGQGHSADTYYHRVHYTIPAMGAYNMPIRDDLAKGPIWDAFTPYRPGDGQTMLVDCHDVTPVPGYGEHGPCFNMPLVKKGDLVIFNRRGVTRTYKVAINPRARWQCYAKTTAKEKSLSLDPSRYRKNTKWYGYCPHGYNNSFVKDGAVERVYFKCCWPRYTMDKYHYFYAVLVRTRYQH